MPFVLRNGVYDNVPPAAVEEFDLLELFFQFHPQAFGQGAGVGAAEGGLALSFVFDAHTASADQGQVNDGFSLSSIHWAGLDSM